VNKRKLLLAVSMAFIVAILVACSGGDSNNNDDNNNNNNNNNNESANYTEEEVTIEFMTISLSPTFDDYINGVIDKFEDENPGVTVKWIDEPIDQIEQVVLTQGASGDLPDVINLNTLYTKKLGGLDALVNLDKEASEYREDYFEGLWKSGEVNGNNYAFPWYVTTDATLYNPELLEKAGIDEVPRTFEEALEVSETILDKTGAYGFPLNITMEKLLPLYGVPIVSDDGTEAIINTDEAARVWTYLKEKYDDGIIPQEVVTGQAQVSELYAQEKVAFWYTGPQKFREVKDLSPEIYEKSDVAPAFITDKEIERAAIMNIVVPSGGENTDLAVEFGAFITNAENQLEFAKEANVLPSVIEAAEDEYFKVDESLTDPGEKGNNVAAQQLDIAIDTTIPTENASEITSVVREEFERVLLEDKDVQEALEDAEAAIEELLAELD